MAVDAVAKPQVRGHQVYEDGIWMGVDNEAEWDHWYASLAEPFPKVIGRVHIPPRFDGTRPRGRRPRSRSRARSPSRPDDEPPDVDLTALRVISPEAFASLLEASGL
jgi:hypothetical protein